MFMFCINYFYFCFCFRTSAATFARSSSSQPVAGSSYNSGPVGPSSFSSPVASCSGTQTAVTTTSVERLRDDHSRFVTDSGELLSDEQLAAQFQLNETVGRGDFVADADFDKTMQDVLALSLLSSASSSQVSMDDEPAADRSLDRRPSVSVQPVQRGKCGEVVVF